MSVTLFVSKALKKKSNFDIIFLGLNFLLKEVSIRSYVMKVMKSIALVGAAAFVLAFASCGSTQVEAAPEEETQTVAPVETQEETATEDTTSATEATEEAAPAEVTTEEAAEAAAEEAAPVEVAE